MKDPYEGFGRLLPDGVQRRGRGVEVSPPGEQEAVPFGVGC
ncbi:hypothetical protein [Streptomyces sp. NPDC016626]